jgi:ribosome-associated protein
MKMHHSMRTNQINFELRGEFITLDALLKATGLASSGGTAKGMITQGLVRVDGQTELRKTCKIRAGQRVEIDGAQVHVQAASAI